MAQRVADLGDGFEARPFSTELRRHEQREQTLAPGCSDGGFGKHAVAVDGHRMRGGDRRHYPGARDEIVPELDAIGLGTM